MRCSHGRRRASACYCIPGDEAHSQDYPAPPRRGVDRRRRTIWDGSSIRGWVASGDCSLEAPADPDERYCGIWLLPQVVTPEKAVQRIRMIDAQRQSAVNQPPHWRGQGKTRAGWPTSRRSRHPNLPAHSKESARRTRDGMSRQADAQGTQFRRLIQPEHWHHVLWGNPTACCRAMAQWSLVIDCATCKPTSRAIRIARYICPVTDSRMDRVLVITDSGAISP
jgi:hypothetical protein